MADTATPGAIAPTQPRGLTASANAGIPMFSPVQGETSMPEKFPASPRGRIVGTFRQRRSHGVFMIAGHVVGIFSKPSATGAGSVCVTADHSAQMVEGSMTADTARAIGRALLAAARAADGASATNAGNPASPRANADLLAVAQRVDELLTRQKWRPGEYDPEARLLRDARAAIAAAGGRHA